MNEINVNTIVVTDIYGKTPALEELCSKLEGQVQIIDPYNGVFFKFFDEVEAYNYFMDVIGMNSYGILLKKAMLNQDKPFKMLGFSIGASAIWMNSQNKNLKYILSAECFYGSQIRNMTNINPTFPIAIVLPSKEEYFSIDELSEKLKEKSHVKIEKTIYLHGFMNRLSKNFNEYAYKIFLKS